MSNLNPVGVWGSAISNMLALLLLMSMDPPWVIEEPHFEWDFRPYVWPEPLWTPFIDRPADEFEEGVPAAQSSEQTCPDNAAYDVPATLVFAPIPKSFNAIEGFDAPARFACAFVRPDGIVAAVHLLRASADKEANRALLRAIKADWRFSPASTAGRPVATWQRVRINYADLGRADLAKG